MENTRDLAGFEWGDPIWETEQAPLGSKWRLVRFVGAKIVILNVCDNWLLILLPSPIHSSPLLEKIPSWRNFTNRPMIKLRVSH